MATDTGRIDLDEGAPAALAEAATVEEAAQLRAPWFGRLLDRLGALWTFGVLVVIVVAFGIAAPTLFTKAAWLSTSNYAVEYLILAVGQTFVIITGEIDLSDGAILGFSAMAGSLLMNNLLDHHVGGGLTAVLGIALMLLSGAAIGFLNGVLRTVLKIPSFIVTLGMMIALSYGATYLLTNGNELYNFPSSVSNIATTTVLDGWLQVPVFVALAIALVFGLALARTRFGLRTYAIGSNRLAAKRAGISVDRHIIVVFTLSGLLAGVAGLMVTSNLASAAPIAGQNDELYAIAAVVIGGASLFGGRGTVFGTTIGTAVLAVLTTGLVLANVASFWQYVAIGAIVIAAVGIDQVRTRTAD
jgi:ribose transport system permease protein